LQRQAHESQRVTHPAHPALRDRRQRPLPAAAPGDLLVDLVVDAAPTHDRAASRGGLPYGSTARSALRAMSTTSRPSYALGSGMSIRANRSCTSSIVGSSPSGTSR